MFDKRSDLVRFLGVAEAGKIGLTADRLSMTQPALTRVIARLERQLGARLFERTPTGCASPRSAPPSSSPRDESYARSRPRKAGSMPPAPGAPGASA